MTTAAPVVIDLKRRLAALYRAGANPSLVEVPPLRCLAVNGEGSPEGADFQAAIGALYAMAYGAKFGARKQLGLDYPVMPLEGLWSTASGAPFTSVQSSDVRWKLFIVIPAELPASFLEQVRGEAVRKQPAAAKVAVEMLDEGRSAQVMHLGPYDAEAPTIGRLEAFIAGLGLRLSGPHHEIYLGDPRRAAPGRLKTIIRHPVA